MKDELTKIAYEKYYFLIQHYSSLLFRGRISIMTLAVLIWAYILGVGSKSSGIPFNLFSLILLPKSIVSLMAAYIIPIFVFMENAYFHRLFDLIIAAKNIEQEYELDHFFSRYHGPRNSPFHGFYALNCIMYSFIFLYDLFTKNQGYKVETLVFSAWPKNINPLIFQ